MDANNDTTRAFIAVDVPEEVKEKIKRTVSKIETSNIKSIKETQMHITIFFLGNATDSQIDGLKKLISGIDMGSFEISLKGIAAFSLKNPHIIFAKIDDGKDELSGIYSLLKENIENLGIKTEEREFTPHLTIIRIRHASRKELESIRDFITYNSSTEFGRFVCNRIKLKKSMLDKNGAQHTDIFEKVLSG